MEDSRHIALLHYSCPPVVGGVEEVLYQQARQFHRNGHRVRVFAGAGERFTKEYPVEINPLLGSRTSEVKEAHRALANGDSAKLVVLTDRILDFFRGIMKGVDVLIAHNVLTMHYNLPLTMALHRMADSDELKIIGWNHDSPFFYQEYPDHLEDPAWNIIKSCSSNIRGVTISRIRQEQFKRLCGEDAGMEVIANGIDPAGFLDLDPVMDQLIREKQLFAADLLVIYPSRLHPRKNVELSIRVISKLRKRGIDARLLLTGSYDPHEDGTFEYLEKLKALSRKLEATDGVLFLAEHFFQSDGSLAVGKMVMRDLYHIADLLLFTSHQEGFGIPLLEAGLTRLPIVCTDIPSFREIGDGDVCYFPIDSPPGAVADLLLEFIEKLPLYRMFRHVTRNYLWENIYRERLLPLVNDVCG
jgi:glycosyltransferase involved in cell wall biosynthesis